jgi:hypothetical protein
MLQDGDAAHNERTLSHTTKVWGVGWLVGWLVVRDGVGRNR